MRVLAYPKFHFFNILTQLKEDSRCALISILNFDDTHTIVDDIPGKSMSVFFDDIGHYDVIPGGLMDHYSKLTLFNEDHAKKIIDFQKTLGPEIEYIIVHCTAGVSRSGAVATFFQDMYNIGNDESNEWFAKNNRQIIPNRHVLKILREVLECPHIE
jgi:predicted protein tyrosine phosphatase